jgi:hypothetical protein
MRQVNSISASGTKLLQWAWVLLLPGCTEPFTPVFEESDSLLVVDASITDQPGPYMVQLSSTRKISDRQRNPMEGAVVCVTTQEGECYQFLEASPGKYVSDSAEWQGKVGSVYTLEITLGGLHYLSLPDTLKYTPPIDSIYYQPEDRLTDLGEPLSGVAVFADTHDDRKKTHFYKYDWIESWEIKVEWPIVFEFWRCYDSYTSTSVLINNTSKLLEDRVSRFELNYVSTEGFRLVSVYSMLVQQTSLDRAGYEYWQNVKSLNENNGTLYDPQPYQIKSNIYNIQNSEEVVLGYFDAVSVREKRIFIYNSELRDLHFPPKTCYLLANLDPDHIPERCSDCRTHGGSLIKPDFWPN